MHNPASNNKHSHGVEWSLLDIAYEIGGNWSHVEGRAHATVVQGFAISLAKNEWSKKPIASLYGSQSLHPLGAAMVMWYVPFI